LAIASGGSGTTAWGSRDLQLRVTFVVCCKGGMTGMRHSIVRVVTIAGIVAFGLATAARAADDEPPGLLRTLETDDLRLIYINPTENYLAPHAARSFENSLQGQRDIFDWQPDEEVTVLLKDFSDYGNAAARANPRNALLVDIAPLSLTFETFAPGERMYTLMNHELVHVATMDKANAQDRKWRRFFSGKVYATAEHPETIFYQYLTTPRTAVPRWYLEGSAVFMETWMAGGLGRAQGAFDEMVFRAMVRDDAHFYDPLGLASEGMKADFQVGATAYLYGTRFMNYLAWQYSPEMLVEWLARTEDSERYYRSQFIKVFGMTLDEAWKNWIDWEHEFQNANLVEVRKYPITRGRRLSDQALGSISQGFLDKDNKRLYAGFRYPGVVAHLGSFSLEDGSVDKIVDIKGPMQFRVTSLTRDPETRKVYYATDNYAYRDLMVVDEESGETTMLLKDARIGEFVFNHTDKSIWGVRHLNGIVTLVRIPPPYDTWNQIHSFEYGEMLYDMDISPDGRLLSTSFGTINGDQSLRIFELADLNEGEVRPVGEFDFDLAVPEGFVFSPDGRYLFGSVYYTGVSNIFRYELATGDIQAVSNAETGFFRPLPLDNDRLIVFEFTGDGFIPVEIKAEPLEDLGTVTFMGQQVIEKHPVLKEWQVGSPADIPLEEMITHERDYEAWKEMGLESMYPIALGYRDSVAVGLHANITDPIGFSRLSIDAAVSPEIGQDPDEQTHAYIKYQYREWTTELKYNYANFYDLFGPTDVARKGHSAEVTYNRTLIFDKPRYLDLEVSAGYFGDLDEVPYAQDIETAVDELATAQVRLDGSNIRSSLGNVDDEKGHKWSLVGGGNYRENSVIPYAFANFDVGWALPLKHSSIWLRNSAGYADGDEDDSFANFFFGGFGNNWVDHQEVKRYREPFALPGHSISDIAGQSYFKSMIEWTLPPVLFERAGTPSFFATWMRPALFGAVLVTDPDDGSETYGSLGGQLDFQFNVFSSMPMTFSVGYALGLVDGSFDKSEFMASLKIL
jgi:hypothetical protein